MLCTTDAKDKPAVLEAFEEAKAEQATLASILSTECNSTAAPWQEKTCGGPCAFEFEGYAVADDCKEKLLEVLGEANKGCNCFSEKPIFAKPIDGQEKTLKGINTCMKPTSCIAKWVYFEQLYGSSNKSGWYNEDIEKEIIFDARARRNIVNNNWNAYKTISDRNDWYKWADKIARKKDNYWFAAAVDVTSWRAVGAAGIPNLAYITDPEEFIMRSINSRLLKQNFKNFGPYLLYPDACITDTKGKPLCNLKGVALEKEMVVIEQTEVENMILEVKNQFISKFGNKLEYCYAAASNENSNKKTPWDCAIWGINRVSDGSCKACTLMNFFLQLTVGNDPYNQAKNSFKEAFPNVLYDFLNIEHRIYIGQEMAKQLRN